MTNLKVLKTDKLSTFMVGCMGHTDVVTALDHYDAAKKIVDYLFNFDGIISLIVSVQRSGDPDRKKVYISTENILDELGIEYQSDA